MRLVVLLINDYIYDFIINLMEDKE